MLLYCRSSDGIWERRLLVFFIKVCVIVSPDDISFGVHGARRTFYAYKDTVVIGKAKRRGNIAIIKRFRVI